MGTNGEQVLRDGKKRWQQTPDQAIKRVKQGHQSRMLGDDRTNLWLAVPRSGDTIQGIEESPSTTCFGFDC